MLDGASARCLATGLDHHDETRAAERTQPRRGRDAVWASARAVLGSNRGLDETRCGDDAGSVDGAARVRLREGSEPLVCAVVGAEPARASRGMGRRGCRGESAGMVGMVVGDSRFAIGVGAGRSDVAVVAKTGGEDLFERGEESWESCGLASDGTV